MNYGNFFNQLFTGKTAPGVKHVERGETPETEAEKKTSDSNEPVARLNT